MFDMKSETLPTLRGPCCITGYVPSIWPHKKKEEKKATLQKKLCLKRAI